MLSNSPTDGMKIGYRKIKRILGNVLTTVWLSLSNNPPLHEGLEVTIHFLFVRISFLENKFGTDFSAIAQGLRDNLESMRPQSLLYKSTVALAELFKALENNRGSYSASFDSLAGDVLVNSKVNKEVKLVLKQLLQQRIGSHK